MSEKRIIFWLNEIDFKPGEGFMVSLVEENEPGHAPQYRIAKSGNLKAARKMIEEWNAERGITAEQAAHIALSSMFAQKRDDLRAPLS